MTKANIEKILRTVELGVWPDRAADMHGISKAAMRQHKKRNPEFVTALKKAEAMAETGIHGKMLRHMDKQWTACAWMLERRWPGRWGKQPDVQLQVNQNVETTTGPPQPDDVDLFRYIEKLADIAQDLDVVERPNTNGKANGKANGTNGTNGTSRLPDDFTG